MNPNKIRLLTVFSSIALGILSYLLFSSWYNIIPWMIAGVLVGFLILNRKQALINGALYGYFLFLSYVFIGYRGNQQTSQVIHFILVTLLYSLIGAIAGIVGAFIGNFILRKTKKIS